METKSDEGEGRERGVEEKVEREREREEEKVKKEREREESFVERAKFIPVRLSLKERKYLRLLQASLKVNDYADKVDQPSLSNSKRTYTQILEICSVLSGMALSCDYKLGQELVVNRNLKDNTKFYQSIIELGRRHKVLNPDKMRLNYPKLQYMCMDAMSPQVKNLLEFAVKGFSNFSPLTIYLQTFFHNQSPNLLSQSLFFCDLSKSSFTICFLLSISLFFLLFSFLQQK